MFLLQYALLPYGGHFYSDVEALLNIDGHGNYILPKDWINHNLANLWSQDSQNWSKSRSEGSNLIFFKY